MANQYLMDIITLIITLDTMDTRYLVLFWYLYF